MANVAVIDRKLVKGAPAGGGKPRVCAYARVSTAQDGQISSFDNQVEIYTDMIRKKPEWEFAGVYADLAQSGTKENRPQFQKMMQDCENGLINIIITKSIARFARNTLITLEKIRWLKSLGVSVIFEKEDIDTSQPYSEMLLTILAAFAQEESRSISERTKKGIQMNAAEGKVRWRNTYGYTKGENDEYIIDEDKAKTIQLIFRLYEHGSTMKEIVEELKRQHIYTPSGKRAWTESCVHSIIDNERYVGDILTNKFVTEDHLSHHIVRNTGQVDQVKITDHHAGIIDRGTWDRVQAIREMKSKRSGSVTYPFGNMLRCPYCGGVLRQRVVAAGAKATGWACGECEEFIILSSYVENAVLKAYERIDMKAVEKNLEKLPGEAGLMISVKEQNPTFERVDFWWVDDLVEHIDLGSHESIGPRFKPDENIPSSWKDATVTVFWKCGVVTTVFSGVEDLRDAPMSIFKREQKSKARRTAKEKEMEMVNRKAKDNDSTLGSMNRTVV